MQRTTLLKSLSACAAAAALTLSASTARAFDPTFTDSGQTLYPNGDKAMAQHTSDIALVDMDGDGDLDIVNPSDGTMPGVIYVNDGKGKFTTGAVFNTTPGNYETLAVADFDKDGKLDITMGSFRTANQAIWFNKGGGTFTRTVLNVLGENRGVAAGDLDGDGDLDLLASTGKVFWNDGKAGFTAGPTFMPTDSYYVNLADLDKDGDLDATICNFWPDIHTLIFLNDGKGTFTQKQALDNTTNFTNTGIADLDADGDLDLVVSESTNVSRVWLNDGKASFTKGGSFAAPKTARYALADFDKDGDIDVFSAGPTSSLWANDGKGGFTQVIGTTWPANTGLSGGAADVNGDGWTDIVIGTGCWQAGCTGPTYVFLNNGKPVVPDMAMQPMPDMAMTPMTDMAMPAAKPDLSTTPAAPDMSTTGSSGGGCNVDPGAAGPSGALALLVAASALVLGRRRRR